LRVLQGSHVGCALAAQRIEIKTPNSLTNSASTFEQWRDERATYIGPMI